MQRSTAINAQDLCGFLELLLISLLIIHVFIVIVIFILLLTPGGFSLVLIGLAGALSPWPEYFVLEWLERNHGRSWRTSGKPCRGALRLPVPKFGVLRYPYFSTPTGAPGPRPYTVPSAVGLGPKQGTGTRGLGPHKI